MIPLSKAIILGAGLLLAGTTHAADEDAGGSADKSGTNPLNLQNTAVIFNEYQDLDGAYRNTTNLRYIQGFADGTMAVRLTAPIVATDVGGETETGLGDFNLRYNYVPYVTQKFGLMLSCESWLDTASEDVLGRGKTSLAPVVVAAFFLSPQWIFAPAYQYNVSLDVLGDDDRADIRESYIDLYLVWTSANKQQWAILDPTIVVDHENDHESMTVEGEVGQIFGKALGGVYSAYVRPGIGIGSYRAYEWNLEIGIKLIGF